METEDPCLEAGFPLVSSSISVRVDLALIKTLAEALVLERHMAMQAPVEPARARSCRAWLLRRPRPLPSWFSQPTRCTRRPAGTLNALNALNALASRH